MKIRFKLDGKTIKNRVWDSVPRTGDEIKVCLDNREPMMCVVNNVIWEVDGEHVVLEIEEKEK